MLQYLHHLSLIFFLFHGLQSYALVNHHIQLSAFIKRKHAIKPASQNIFNNPPLPSRISCVYDSLSTNKLDLSLYGSSSSTHGNDEKMDDNLEDVQKQIADMLSKDFNNNNEIDSNKSPSSSETNSPFFSRISRILLAASSSLLAFVLFIFYHSQPVSSLTLLNVMEKESVPLSVALCNGKPTIIDFYADWCENCKSMAPDMRYIEKNWEDKVNFITVDGTSSNNYDLVSKFKVDGIPHLAFIGNKGDVKTSLIGAVPRKILEEEVNALVKVRIYFIRRILSKFLRSLISTPSTLSCRTPSFHMWGLMPFLVIIFHFLILSSIVIKILEF